MKQERILKASIISLDIIERQLEDIVDAIYNTEDLTGYRKAIDCIFETVIEVEKNLKTL